jgi:hypothetical protein
MATTLAAFVSARVAMVLWVRPHLLSPLHTTVSLLSADRFGFASSNGSSLQLSHADPLRPMDGRCPATSSNDGSF